MPDQPEKIPARNILLDWCQFLKKYEPIYKYTADSMDQLANAALGTKISFPRTPKTAPVEQNITPLVLNKTTFTQFMEDLVKVRFSARETDNAIRGFYNDVCRVEFGTGYLQSTPATKEKVEGLASTVIAETPATERTAEEVKERAQTARSELEKLQKGLEELKKK